MKFATYLILFCVYLFVAPFVQGSEADRINKIVKPVRDQVSKHEERIRALETSVQKDSNEQNKRIADHDQQINALETSVKRDSGEQNKRIDQLEETVGKQAAAINKLIVQLKEVQGKLDITAKAIDKVDGVTVENRKRVHVLLSVLTPVVIVVLAVFAFFFWPRNTIVSPAVDVSGRSKCPRCGWEHDPADTVCKNPACKTQF